MDFFQKDLPFYKGNLHTHTTISDGTFSDADCIAAYQKKGYQFMAITDHRKFYSSRQTDDFLIIAGTEFHYHDLDSRRAFHIVGLGLTKPVESDDSTHPQTLIDRIHEAGGMAVLAHPMWSLLTHEDLMGLTGFDHIEVYNHLSEAYSNRGYSENYLDVLASKGIVKKMTAVDDCHFYALDLFGGWIMLQSRSFSQDGVIEALRQGSYYSTMGPEIHQITMENGIVSVSCSEAASIAFVTDAFFEPKRMVCAEGKPLTFASYKPGNLDRLVRIEIRDKENKKCWSNFIDLAKEAFA